ncbi:MAG TPA: HD domain-containing protein [Tepidisphaeraceae bacterium]|jgi:3'-5' exoribonuclease
MRRLYLRDAASGDVVDDVFVVTNKQFAAASTGKYYIKAFVSDATAQLVARMWNTTREIFNWMPDSGFLKVRGRIENYQNNLQFIIESVGPARDGSYDIADLVAHTTKSVPEMCETLRAILGRIRNRHLKAVVDAYLSDKPLMDNFCKAPAAQSFHHAYLGGLLEHTLNAMQVAEAVMPFYPGLNRDLVIAGIFLHDIAKTWELCYDCAFSYTDSGQLVGHIVKSAIWVEHKAKEASDKLGEPIPQELIDVLQHIILAHHGTHEFGSPRTPATPEAIAVHQIENMDAKLMMSLGATRGGEDGSGASAAEGNWTEYMKAFGGKLYRPDVAPADGAAEAEAAPMPERAEPPRTGAFPRAADPAPSVATPKPKPVLSNPLFEAAPPRKG